MPPFVTIAFLFLAAGLLGGYAGYLQSPPKIGDQEREKGYEDLIRSLVLGVVGAFLIPVFLAVGNAASGNQEGLIDQIASNKSTTSGWFVLFGFSLLAGISAQRLISNLTEQLFIDMKKKVESTQRATDSVRQEVEDLNEDMLEVAREEVQKKGELASLDDKSKKALKLLTESPQRRPSLLEIANFGELDSANLAQPLKDLEKLGLISKKERDGETTYRVRSTGRAIYASMEERE